MPLATPAQYAQMLAAKAGGYAIPTVNVSSSTTLSAANSAAAAEQVDDRHTPGKFALRPSILGEPSRRSPPAAASEPQSISCSTAAAARHRTRSPRLSHGVIKMNLDTDARYACTRLVADHMFVNYAGVVRADCGIGDKRPYDAANLGPQSRAGDGGTSRGGLPATRLRR